MIYFLIGKIFSRFELLNKLNDFAKNEINNYNFTDTAYDFFNMRIESIIKTYIATNKDFSLNNNNKFKLFISCFLQTLDKFKNDTVVIEELFSKFFNIAKNIQNYRIDEIQQSFCINVKTEENNFEFEYLYHLIIILCLVVMMIPCILYKLNRKNN